MCLATFSLHFSKNQTEVYLRLEICASQLLPVNQAIRGLILIHVACRSLLDILLYHGST